MVPSIVEGHKMFAKREEVAQKSPGSRLRLPNLYAYSKLIEKYEERILKLKKKETVEGNTSRREDSTLIGT